MTQYLEPSQQRRVEELARGKGISCARCGSEDLSAEEARRVGLA